MTEPSWEISFFLSDRTGKHLFGPTEKNLRKNILLLLKLREATLDLLEIRIISRVSLLIRAGGSLVGSVHKYWLNV